MLRYLDTRMAVLTVDLKLANMELMGKRHWLLGTIANICYIVAHAEVEDERTDSEHSSATKDRGFEYSVNTL